MMESAYEEFIREVGMRMLYLEKELEKLVGRERAFEIIGKANERALIELAEEQVDALGGFKNFEDYKVFFRKALTSPFLSCIVRGSIAKETPKEIAAHITDCLWHKTFRKLNATDLGYVVCCQPDFAVASHYHPKIKMKRTKTLMQGDECCNHTYYWEE
ncbi:MAG: L-2-amino-thiazoline-4-carboxylic acid hydrolase [Candidatus Bathyarchaeia archaeon]